MPSFELADHVQQLAQVIKMDIGRSTPKIEDAVRRLPGLPKVSDKEIEELTERVVEHYGYFC
jgi:hypothetical protein